MTTTESHISCAPGIDRRLRRFFWDAALVSRRDPRLAMLFARAATRQGGAEDKRRQWRERGVPVPALLLMSVNRGRERERVGGAPRMTSAEIREVFAESAGLGVSMVCLGGAEPLSRPELLDIAGQFPELTFVLFTSGALLDDVALSKLECYRNIVPVLRLGDPAAVARGRSKSECPPVVETMAGLQSRRLFFGTSVVITRSEFALVTSRVFVRRIVGQGCRLLSFAEPGPRKRGGNDDMPTPAQRKVMPLTVGLLRKEFPAVFLASSADSGRAEGCLAAARGFVHVNPEGGLEPCPFQPCFDENVCDAGLRQALRSRLLKEMRERTLSAHATDSGCASCIAQGRLGSLLQGPEQMVAARADRLVA